MKALGDQWIPCNLICCLNRVNWLLTGQTVLITHGIFCVHEGRLINGSISNCFTNFIGPDFVSFYRKISDWTKTHDKLGRYCWIMLCTHVVDAWQDERDSC